MYLVSYISDPAKDMPNDENDIKVFKTKKYPSIN